MTPPAIFAGPTIPNGVLSSNYFLSSLYGFRWPFIFIGLCIITLFPPLIDVVSCISRANASSLFVTSVALLLPVIVASEISWHCFLTPHWQDPTTQAKKVPKNQKWASFSRSVSARLSLHSSSTVKNSLFSFLNRGIVFSTTIFLPAVSHVFLFAFNDSADQFHEQEGIIRDTAALLATDTRKHCQQTCCT